MKTLYIGGLAMALCVSAQAFDSDLRRRSQAYQERQQATQGQELELARAALRNGDLEAAQKHLDIARNLAYTPDAISTLEQQITAEKYRREQERLAKEQREREEQQRLAQAQREEQARRTQASSSTASASSSVANSAIQHELSWGYGYSEIHIPPAYETKLKERGIFFREYYLETTQSRAGYTVSDLEKVYFSVKLRNPTNRAVNVTYKIKAREKFSVGRAVETTVDAGFWGFLGAMGGALLNKEDPAAGAALGGALGGAYGVSRQDEQNAWFNKEKTFTVTLAPGEETYETGIFPVSQRLSQAPEVEIVRVE